MWSPVFLNGRRLSSLEVDFRLCSFHIRHPLFLNGQILLVGMLVVEGETHIFLHQPLFSHVLFFFSFFLSFSYSITTIWKILIQIIGRTCYNTLERDAAVLFPRSGNQTSLGLCGRQLC